MPKIDAIGVVSSDIKKTVEYYTLLGFEFGKFDEGEDHVEAKSNPGETRLMIDSIKLFEDLTGESLKPGNSSAFAVLYDSPKEVDEVARKIKDAGFVVLQEPWDSFWGQRYCVVMDPDCYKIDLFANL